MNKHESGQIIILGLIFMTVVTASVGALVGYAGVQIRSHRQAVARSQGLGIAEAGVEAAIWKLNHQVGYAGESNTSFGDGVYSITITNLSGSQKLIRSDSYVPNASNPRGKRSVQVTATIGTENIGFNYGVQAGTGGFTMDENATLQGNVYANGDILGANGSRVNGDAIVAGPTGKIMKMLVSGNSWSHFIEDSTVGGSANHYSLNNTNVTGNVSASSIANCNIGGTASYDSRFACSISGATTTPNTNIPTDPDIEPLPIQDAQINDWEQEAEQGGVLGSQVVSGTVSLGPKKISGDLTVNNGSTLIVTGTLWVTGKVTMVNNAIVKLDPVFGSMSGVIVVGVEGSSSAGLIDLSNNVQVLGSGTSGSYLMLLSQMDSCSSTSINVQNNVTGAIFYAGLSQIDVSNNGGAKELTACKIFLDNNSTITYESGLANANFSSGPGGGWQVADQTWQLLQ